MTPLMRQYWDIKSLHKDKILFFRMGDFFELFFDDAVTAAPLVGITLTQRNKKSQDETPMCGLPHHAVAGPINKLLSLGFKVALCDQIEDPKLAKGIVKRAVTQILTPGMVYDPSTLEQNRAFYLACVLGQNLAIVETSTGECLIYEDLNIITLKRLLRTLPIVELVVPDQALFLKLFPDLKCGFLLSEFKDESPDIESLIKNYLKSLGRTELTEILGEFKLQTVSQFLELSPTTLSHLEILEGSDSANTGSLLKAIDRTQTAMGGRLMRERLSFPLLKEADILKRQQKVEYWIQRSQELKQLREKLKSVGDIERRFFRITQNQSNARDVLSLLDALEKALLIYENPVSSLVKKLSHFMNSEAPISVREGGIFNVGYNSELDSWIDLSQNGQKWLSELETREKEKTGIGSLKVRYNHVFGFYIEVTHVHKEKIPSHYLRKQTLANAERFYTEELLELEKKILSSQARRNELEYSLFLEVKTEILSWGSEIRKFARIIAELDVDSSLAWLAIESNYVKPRFSKSLKLKSARHPVIERVVKNKYVPNDISMENGEILLLTGPNMAGKSTILRQVALTAIMAQVGSFVPAAEAQIPLFDRIFTRIGAHDLLSHGLSTFMVEMTETAELLNSGTSNSLFILDEVGRGTSTYDGMSLAQSILEYIAQNIKALTLFSTHYHELVSVSQIFPQIKNAHLGVAETSADLRFLYQLKDGPAHKSYGVQVAKRAGLPDQVIKRANQILASKETVQSQTTFENLLLSSEPQRQNPSNEIHEKWMTELGQLDISSTTPMEALVKIEKWKKEMEKLQ